MAIRETTQVIPADIRFSSSMKSVPLVDDASSRQNPTAFASTRSLWNGRFIFGLVLGAFLVRETLPAAPTSSNVFHFTVDVGIWPLLMIHRADVSPSWCSFRPRRSEASAAFITFLIRLLFGQLGHLYAARKRGNLPRSMMAGMAAQRLYFHQSRFFHRTLMFRRKVTNTFKRPRRRH